MTVFKFYETSRIRTSLIQTPLTLPDICLVSGDRMLIGKKKKKIGFW